jgi:hypothetical protein
MEYPDPEINEREAAVLGLLYENPLYGYTIEVPSSNRKINRPVKYTRLPGKADTT